MNRTANAPPDSGERVLQAVLAGDEGGLKELLASGADADARDATTGLTALMMASAQATTSLVGLLLDAGADPLAVDSRAGASVLHKACQGGSVEVVRKLVEAGAFVDSVAATTGHTPLMDALWFKWPALVGYLLEQGAGLKLSTHYGFSLREHFEFELRVNTVGKDRMLEAEGLLRQRDAADEAAIVEQGLMAAVNAGDLASVKELVRSGVDVDARYPRVNGFNDHHTPLLVAARDGQPEIVVELLDAGADVNAVEPVFGAVSLHKAVYNGHADITGTLVAHPGVDLNFTGATNGYSPLHDALWHGYAACADILIQAGASLELRGHDGKTPLDMARAVFAPGDETIVAIESRLGNGAA